MGYCYMHIDKITSVASLRRRHNHNYRLEPVPNADELAISNNEELVKLNGKTYEDALYEKIAKSDYYYRNGKQARKVRKDAVLGLEVMCTFSREERDNIDIEKWKEDNVRWLNETFNKRPDKYGNNVVSVVYHGDEAGNVHLHAVVIPISERGSLSAKSYTSGKWSMANLQSSYGKAMEPHNLKRGLVGSRARHKDVAQFYTALNQSIDIEAPSLKNGETMQHYMKRVTEMLKDAKMQALNEKLKAERKIVEVKATNRQTLIDVRKEMHDIDRERQNLLKEREGFEEKYGDKKKVEAKLKTANLLNDGLKIYPDRAYAEETSKRINKIVKYQKEKRKLLERETLDQKDRKEI